MIAELHVVIYCKYDVIGGVGKVYFARAYKYIDRPKNKTPMARHFLYSDKAKRYVTTDLYFLGWDGYSIPNMNFEHTIMRAALRRIGLDIR